MPPIDRRTALGRLATFLAPGALLAPLALLPGCEAGGNFTLLGYTTRPNYRCDITSVRGWPKAPGAGPCPCGAAVCGGGGICGAPGACW